MKIFEKIYNTERSKFVKPLSNTEMCCPFCGNVLIKTGEQRKLETLDEHVSNSEPTLKDVYVCSNNSCKFGRYRMYNFFGDAYYRNILEFDKLDEKSLKEYYEYIMFATNSAGFRIDCDVTGRGQLIEIRLHKLFMFGYGQPIIEFKYVFDEAGNVLKRKICFGKYRKYNKSLNLYTIKTLGIVSLFNNLRYDIGQIRLFKHSNKSSTSITTLRSVFEFPYNKIWYNKLNTYIIRMLYPILYCKYRSMVKAK